MKPDLMARVTAEVAIVLRAQVNLLNLAGISGSNSELLRYLWFAESEARRLHLEMSVAGDGYDPNGNQALIDER